MWEKPLCRHQGQWGRRRSHWSSDSPAVYEEDHGEAGCPPAACRSPRWSRSPPAACGGPHVGAGGCPKEAVTLWKACTGSGSCGTCRPVEREEPTLKHVCCQYSWPHGGLSVEPSVPEGLQHVERILAGAVGEELRPTGRTHIGEVCGGLSPVGGTPWWSRGRVWVVLLLKRNEWQRQCVMNWPRPPLPVPLQCLGEEVASSGVNFSPGRKQEWGKVF